VFTGIVEHLGRVTAFTADAAGGKLGVDLGPLVAGVKIGDSVAVNGACLTVTSLTSEIATFDVGPESLERTTLGALAVGERVHLERALAAGGRLDGHLVQGHVDCVGQVERAVPRGRAVDLHIAVTDHSLDLVVEKGSIAVAGVSLTVNAVRGQRFEVSLVPHTQTKTFLNELRPGARVNVEFDIIGRYVARLLGRSGGRGSLDEGFLREHGFA
jgi:riboflavin synthase